MSESLADWARALGVPDGVPEYDPTGGPDERIPMARWGKDHWSTFAYVETRIVDHGGKISHDHMRCDADRHPLMHQAKRMPSLGGGDRKYPTRLKDGEQPDHDDYDCLDDAITAGLLEAVMPPAPKDALLTGLVEKQLMAKARYRLTERGQVIAGQLRAHKGSGGNFHDFTPEEV